MKHCEAMSYSEAIEIVSEFDIREAVQIFVNEYGMEETDAYLLYDLVSSCV